MLTDQELERRIRTPFLPFNTQIAGVARAWGDPQLWIT